MFPRLCHVASRPISLAGCGVLCAGASACIFAGAFGFWWFALALVLTLTVLGFCVRHDAVRVEVGTDGVLVGGRFVPHTGVDPYTLLDSMHGLLPRGDVEYVRKLIARRKSDLSLAARLEATPIDGMRASYRDALPPVDSLWAILEDGRAPFPARLAAARLLRRSQGEAACVRIQTVADATARPEAREAFVVASLGESP